MLPIPNSVQDALNGDFALQMMDPKGETTFIISLQVNTLELYMNYSSLDGFTNLYVGQVTAESFSAKLSRPRQIASHAL